jgi:hypothetical protein
VKRAGGEAFMQKVLIRTLIISLLLALLLASGAGRAQTGWQTYSSNELNFSFEAPDGIVSEIGATIRGTYVGTKEQIVFRTEENNIEYRVGVTNFAQAQAISETVLGEALFLFQEGKTVLRDTFARVGEGRDMVYGRRSTVELSQGGQATTAFFFTNGMLYQLTATVAGANGDISTPGIDTFIGSVRFEPAGAGANAMELTLPEF